MSWARTSIWSHIGELFLAFDFLSVLRGSFVFFIPATTANDLRLRRISIQDLIHYICFSILNFIYITTNTNQVIQLILIMLVDQHRCLRSNGLRVGGNRSTRGKPTCLTCWPHDHLTCRRRVSNPGRSDERPASHIGDLGIFFIAMNY